MPLVEGSHTVSGLEFAIVVSRFNDFVTERLLGGAREALQASGVTDDHVVVLRVPGAFEIPIAAQQAAETGRFGAVVCLGCLIRGATPHFEYIASSVAHGLQHVASLTRVPVTFGVLTTNSAEEAIERAGSGPTNKGYEAALAAVEMATLARTMTRQYEATRDA
jgi:6,7-dimethyl-8-ribityllumazine synthase